MWTAHIHPGLPHTLGLFRAPHCAVFSFTLGWGIVLNFPLIFFLDSSVDWMYMLNFFVTVLFLIIDF